MEYDIKLTIKDLLETEKLISDHDREVREVGNRHGIKLLTDKRIVLLSMLIGFSKENREAHDHEGDQGVIKLGQLLPKGNSVKINAAIEYLEKMQAQNKIGEKKFNEIVTYGQGDKKRVSKIELY